MSKDINLELGPALKKLPTAIPKLKRYALLGFIVLVAGTYSYVVLQINTLGNVEPTPDQVASQVEAVSAPKVDENIVRQLKALEDNSVSVRALFDEARKNPFYEPPAAP